jgi:hypothetical protein
MPKYQGPRLHKSSVLSLHSSSPQLPKRRNAEISWRSINGSQRSLGSTVRSNRDFAILWFGILKDKSLCLSNSHGTRNPKMDQRSRSACDQWSLLLPSFGHQEALAANLLTAPPDPMACGVSVFLLEDSPPSVQVSRISPPGSTQR